MFLENCTFTSTSPVQPYFLDHQSGAGPTFLRTTTAAGQMRLWGAYSDAYGISLHSSVANWDTITLHDRARKYKLD